jgi:hypothetical protein
MKRKRSQLEMGLRQMSAVDFICILLSYTMPSTKIKVQDDSAGKITILGR